MKTELLPERLRTLILDPHVTDICINQPQEIYFDQGQGLRRWEHSETLFKSEHEYRTFVLENISHSGKTWDAKLPFVDTIFFGTHRAHISFPPLAQYGIYLSLRKLPKKPNLLGEVQPHNWTDSENETAFQLLSQAVSKHETLILAGGTGSGKTTLLNDLLRFAEPNERIIGLEDTAELAPHHPHYISLLSRTANADGIGQVTLRDLLRQTLRMRPDRILLGECRGDEVLDLLQALNTGHRGTLCTLHANSAREALKRIELLALLGAKGTIPPTLIRELIATGIQKVAFLKQINGKRKIQAIVQVEGKEGDTLLTRPLWPLGERLVHSRELF